MNERRNDISFIFGLCMLIHIFAAHPSEASEISLGGGYAFVTDDASSGLGDTSSVSKGGMALEGEFVTGSGIEFLELGLEVGYLKYSHAQYPTGITPGYSRDESLIPILGVGRYRFYDRFFGELKAGIALDRISTDSASFSNNTTPYFSMGAGVGYSLAIVSGFSIEPRVDAYMTFVSGAYTQIAPTLNLGYEF